jgi:hypothetical protein
VKLRRTGVVLQWGLITFIEVVVWMEIETSLASLARSRDVTWLVFRKWKAMGYDILEIKPTRWDKTANMRLISPLPAGTSFFHTEATRY